ncbi:hypothetical protein PFISCL1PPCAC_14674, partial [Pristionchus fissidentatus]
QMTVSSNGSTTNGQTEEMDIDQENGNPAKKQKLMSKEDFVKVMDDVEKHSLIVDEKWYLVSLNWWKKAEKAVNDGYMEDIQPIDNSKISTRGISGAFYLAPKLVERMDFIPVPEKSFEVLNDSFGVVDAKRDIIERLVIDDGLRGNRIDVYPKVVNVILARDRSRRVTLPLRNDTVGSLRERALRELGVNESLHKIRFYIEHGDKFELLNVKDDDEVANLFSSEPTVVVDIVDENGKGFISNRINESYNEISSSPSYTRGVCGLSNLGNTCFMASAVQCLSNVPQITEYFLTDQYTNDLNEANPLGTEGHLAKEYGKLMHAMWSGRHESFVPRNFKSTIGKFAPRFSGYAQQDSQELLAFLLDGLHEDLNRIRKKPYVEEKEPAEGTSEKAIAEEAWANYRKRNDSIIVDKVHGQLKSTLVCPKCAKVSVKFDPFCFLSVPVPTKERLFRTPIVLMFNPLKKWARFALNITRTTTVAQALDLIMSELGEKIEVIVFTVDSMNRPTLMEMDDPLCGENRNRYAIVYACQVTRAIEGSELVIARTMGEKKLTYSSKNLPVFFTIPLNQSEEAVKEFGEKEIVPVVKGMFEKDGIEEERYKCGVEVTRDGDKWMVDLIFDEVNVLEDVRGTGLIDREKSMPEPKQDVSLVDCINMFTKKEQLSEQDSWYCPQCKEHVLATKKLDIWKLPQILVVHLKRFQYTRWSREKIDTPVDIPGKDFHLRDILVNDSHEDAVYDLIAISHHMGGLGGGHYTATALNGETWYYFNDASVSKACAPYGTPSSSPYLLFYRRRELPIIHSDEHLDMETED